MDAVSHSNVASTRPISAESNPRPPRRPRLSHLPARSLAVVIVLPIVLVALSHATMPKAPPAPPVRAAHLQAATPLDFDSSQPSYGGLPRALARRGNVLYVAQGWRIDTFTLDDPTKPRLLGPALPLDGPSRDMAVLDDRLFATVGGSLHVFSLRDDVPPTPLFVLDLGAEASTLHVADGLAYVALQRPGAGTVAIVDVSDGAAPALLHEIPTDERAASSLATLGTALYATSSRLWVFDVSVPSRPVAGDASAVPWCCYQRVAVAGGRLFAAYDERVRGNLLTFVSAFHLDDPLRPVDRGGTGTNPYQVLELRVQDGWVLKLGGAWRSPSWLGVFAGGHGEQPSRYLARSGVLGTPVDAVATDSHVYVLTESCGLQSIAWDPPAMERLEFQDMEVGASIPVAGRASDVAVVAGSPLVLTSDSRWCSRIDRLPPGPSNARLPSALTPLPGEPEQMVSAARGVYVLEYGDGPLNWATRLVEATADGGLRDSGLLPARQETAMIAFDRARAELIALSSNAELEVTSSSAPAVSDAWLERFGGADGMTPLGVAPILGLEWPMAMAADAGRVAVLGEPTGAESEAEIFVFGSEAGGSPAVRLPAPYVGDQSYAMAMRGPALYLAGAGLRAYALGAAAEERPRWEAAREPSYEAPVLDVLGDRLAYAEADLLTLYDIKRPLAPRELNAWRLPAAAAGVTLLGDRILVAMGDEGLASFSLLPPGWVGVERIYLPGVER